MDIPGEGDARDNRLAGLGPLSGTAVGVVVSALAGSLHRTLRTRGHAIPVPIAVLLISAAVGAARVAALSRGWPRLAVTAPVDAVTQPTRRLAPVGRVAITLLGAQGLVMDKLPQTPSRFEQLSQGTPATAGRCRRRDFARRAPELVEQVATRPASPPVPRTSDVLACGRQCRGDRCGRALPRIRLRAMFAEQVGNDYGGAGLDDAVGIGFALLISTTPLHRYSSSQRKELHATRPH